MTNWLLGLMFLFFAGLFGVMGWVFVSDNVLLFFEYMRWSGVILTCVAVIFCLGAIVRLIKGDLEV